MTATVTPEQWTAARTELAAAADRFGTLLRHVPRPGTTMATADWSVAALTAHVVTVAWLYRGIVDTGAPPEQQMPGITAQIRAATVDTVDALNVWVLARYTERDVATLADRLQEDVATLLRSTRDRDPTEPFSWLGGAQVPLAGILAHLANEIVIHGHDVARAVRRRFPVPPRVGALFFDLLVVGAIRGGQGVLFDGGPAPATRGSIAVEFRSAHTRQVTLVLQGSTVTAHEPGGHVDVRIGFDPAVLCLMLFGRVSKARAVLTGGVRIGGPRPWLLPRFLRTLRVPDTRRTGRHPEASAASRGQSPAG